MSDLVYILAFLFGFIWWNIAILYFAPIYGVYRWKEWSLSDDGQETLVEVLNQENGVIDHISIASGQLIKSMFEGGFGQVAKSLNNNPQIAIQSGIAEQLKDMKWYESALLMKIAQSVPELQPLLGLAQGFTKSPEVEVEPEVTPLEASK